MRAATAQPVDDGGQGLDERVRAIISEESDRLGAPEPLIVLGEDFASPTIAHFGTENRNVATSARS